MIPRSMRIRLPNVVTVQRSCLNTPLSHCTRHQCSRSRMVKHCLNPEAVLVLCVLDTAYWRREGGGEREGREGGREGGRE